MKRDPRLICHLSSVHSRSDVRVFYKQCVSLAKASCKVHLVVADGRGDEQRNGVLIHDLGIFPSRVQRILKSPLKVLAKALSIPAAYYQIHDPELLPVAILLKLFTRAKVFYDIHECYPEMFLHKEYLSKSKSRLIASCMKRLEAFAMKILDRGIAATEHIAEQFSPSKITIIHNYPLLTEWQDTPADLARYSSRNICYLGSITRERGLVQVLKAMEDVDCYLHLAGAYEPAGFREELMALPAWAKVVEHGFVNRSRAAQIFANCALGIVLFDRSPNHLYSLSTKMFEYMAAGLPIVVSDLPGNIKLLDRAGCGIYIDPADTGKISLRLREMLAQPGLLADMGEKGKRLVHTELNWEAEEPLYLSLFGV